MKKSFLRCPLVSGFLAGVFLIFAILAAYDYFNHSNFDDFKRENISEKELMPSKLGKIIEPSEEIPPFDLDRALIEDEKIEESRTQSTKTDSIIDKPDISGAGFGERAKFQWQDPKEITSLNFFGDKDTVYKREKNTHYYLTGQVADGYYKGANLILMTSPCEGMCAGLDFTYFIDARTLNDYNRLIVVPSASSESEFVIPETSQYFEQYFSIDTGAVILDLKYPNVITGPNKRQTLLLDPYVNEFFRADLLKKAFLHPLYGDVFTTADEHSDKNNDLFGRNGFYIRAKDGTVRVYKYNPEFIKNYNLPQFTYNDGKQNDTQYVFTDVGGCGAKNYASVIPPQKIDRNKDLVVAGKNILGDLIYELRDTHHPLLKDLYDTSYVNYGGDTEWPREKIPFDDFVKKHPILFWIDPFDRLIKFESGEFIFFGECGKPVIYLYPKKPIKVSVILEPREGFTYTEPVYENSWEVFAQPTGQLTDLKTGIKYPYLFWEGRGGIYHMPTKGFVVKRPQVHKFLQEKLALLGLNSQEIADFLDFWEPKMQTFPYYFITFWGNQTMNQIAPLEISPKPDTVIRVLMDFQGLDKPIKVPELLIKTPERKGFTVVEWGGILR